MKKQEYIEKYGEAAYLEYRKKKTAAHREWVEANKERVKEQKRQYRKENPEKEKKWAKNSRLKYKERIAASNKKWRLENPEKVKENYIRFCKENPNYHKEHSKIYRSQNKEKCIELQKRWEIENPKKVRAHSLSKSYKRNDKWKSMDTSGNVNTKWIVDNIFSGQKCVYCGDQDWTHLGCDRIDNNKPHTADNVVCSCFICNADRADRYTVEEFKQYRSLHPRACDIPKAPAIQLSETGALKKRNI